MLRDILISFQARTGNAIGPKGAERISQALTVNKALVELDLSCISEEDDEYENPDDDLKYYAYKYKRDPYEEEEDYDEEQYDDDDDEGDALSMSIVNSKKKRAK